MTTIKFQFNSDIRRVSVPENQSFNDVIDLAKNLFNGALPDRFVLKYRDDENDLITVSTDREFQEAVRVRKDVIRFVIEPAAFSQRQTSNKTKVEPFANALEDLINGCPLISDILKGLNVNAEEVSSVFKDIIEPTPRETVKIPVNSRCPSSRPFNCNSTASVFDAPLFGRHPFLNQSQVVHPATCDGCSATIKGIRYKCQQCPDFDFCQICVPNRLDIHNPDHTFEEIFNPFVHMSRHCARPHPTRCPSPPQTADTTSPVINKSEASTSSPSSFADQTTSTAHSGSSSDASTAVKDSKLEVTPEPAHPFETKLQQLEEIGFHDKQKNVELLVRFHGDVVAVVRHLLD